MKTITSITSTLLLSLLFTFNLVATTNKTHTARLTNIVTQADGSIATTVKLLTFTPSRKYRGGTKPLLVKTGEKLLLTEYRAAELKPKPVVRKRARRVSPPPAPPGFKVSFAPASVLPTDLPQNRRPMHVYRLVLDDGSVIFYFTALQTANQGLRFNYGDNIRDVSYLLAEFDPYPAEQEVGAGVFESQFPKGLFVTAVPFAP